MATIDLGLEGVEKQVTLPGITLVDFWAAWCGPCRMFAPVFEAASETYPDITFAKVDTEEQQQLAGMAGISSIPTLMVFRDGILIFNQAGALPGPQLTELIDAVVALDMDEVRKQVESQPAN